MKWTLPAPRPFDWQMKPLDSAYTRLRTLPCGSSEAYIEHDIIRGCTPEMIAWWFHHIGGDMDYEGRRYPRYLVWHPTDHIHWALAKPAPSGGAGVGARFHIVEALKGNPQWLIDTIEKVVKLDTTGIRLSKQVMGLEVSRLEHWFYPHPLGTQYISCLRVGAENGLGKQVINPLLQRYVMPLPMMQAWLQHNIEEVGNFEYFLPALYAQHQATVMA